MQVWRAQGICNDKTTEKMIHRAQGDRKEQNSSQIETEHLDSVLRITSAGLAMQLM